MSLKRVIKALMDLGLPRQDAEIYVYLTKHGPLSEISLAKKLKIKEKQLSWTVKNLKNKELVRTADRTSIELCAIPFEEALNLLIEINKQQNAALQEIKKELLVSWKNIPKRPSKNN
jgi:sugar-specific transcriptional regulator TrmB